MDPSSDLKNRNAIDAVAQDVDWQCADVLLVFVCTRIHKRACLVQTIREIFFFFVRRILFHNK
jgi:hypothetical protein